VSGLQPPDVGLSPRLPEVLDILPQTDPIMDPLYQQNSFPGNGWLDHGQIHRSKIHPLA
jgi:hypothetical protein